MVKEITTQGLRRFNAVMGALHLVQAVLMISFALGIDQFKAFKPPIKSYFLTFDTSSMQLVTDAKTLTELPFAAVVAVFLFLSALAHLIIVTPKGFSLYEKGLKQHINPFRWYEYALSSSLMIALVAILFGVYAIDSLILIFFLNASMNLFGYLMERMNQNREKVCWTPFAFGCVAGIVPWVAVAMNAFGNSDLGEVPWFVFAITFSYFFFFNLFPINMVLQYKRIGPWKNYLYGERVYIILSLVAKTVLAWLVFAGVMQP